MTLSSVYLSTAGGRYEDRQGEGRLRIDRLNIAPIVLVGGGNVYKIKVMANNYRTLAVLLVLGWVGLFLTPGTLWAEDKLDIPSGQNIPKLPVTPDDPKLMEGHVYPNWGPVCQRYTYSVIYMDDKGRAPEYMKIYFNGQLYDMQKEDPSSVDYFRGVKYVYKNVPNKLGSTFTFLKHQMV